MIWKLLPDGLQIIVCSACCLCQTGGNSTMRRCQVYRATGLFLEVFPCGSRDYHQQCQPGAAGENWILQVPGITPIMEMVIWSGTKWRLSLQTEKYPCAWENDGWGSARLAGWGTAARNWEPRLPSAVSSSYHVALSVSVNTSRNRVDDNEKWSWWKWFQKTETL